jgi:hypothetical protein
MFLSGIKKWRNRHVDSETRWKEAQLRHGWELPEKAVWLLRIPIVRTIRQIYLSAKVSKMARAYAAIGVGFGHMNEYDAWVLYAIARGWC